ncbi:MAG: thiamine pyrophosphate-dependent dehydrogenase E1 component subunit alpha [Gammaproteobacteria bacterium]|nr:thiamine pyrophosphate-dependent dehydrogenase E1 component subunit alpha [Gammaproteobacteria bacterium]MDH5801336.1 thiamine pyrophosphate-dependent dehydrogenase E1 component subunit alpha [Gammaproteobacteria bacterium]
MNDILLELYMDMLRIRRVEEALADKYQEQEMRCPMHLCIGQEAVAVGVSRHLSTTDAVFSNHRAHGHYLAKGGDLNRMIAELYGRVSGCCGGRGGSMHLIDKGAGFLGSTPIVGGTVPVAVGNAWAASLRGESSVTVVYFGDGCFEEGVVHESMNFAVLHQLPVIFVCENNNYAVYSPLSQRQPERPIYYMAESYGMASYEGDGNNVLSVQELASEAINKARNRQGPQFLEFKTHRWREHCGPYYDDDLGYRAEGELDYWLDRCPIKLARSVLQQDNVLNKARDQELEDSISMEIEQAFEFAKTSSIPTMDNLQASVYAA